METTALLAAAASLLVMPGPTNALLATAGATVGVQRALPLLAGVVGGYLASILTLRAVIGPALSSHPALELGLRACAMAYLLMLATKMWQQGRPETQGEEGAPAISVTLTSINLTTLLNPKSLILAFAILPERGTGGEDLSLLLMLAALMVFAGTFWIALGAALRRGFAHKIPANFGYRICAGVLVLLAGTISAQAIIS